MARFRLLLFADPRSTTSTMLLAAALKAADRAGAEAIAVVDAAGRSAGRMAVPRTAAARLARRTFDRHGPNRAGDHGPLRHRCAPLARRHGVPVLVPPGRKVNEPAFVERVRRDLRPNGALALLVAQVFEPPLLAACGAPANYHNGLLPSYRGIAATAWSVYHGAPRSGFAFHRMTERVDGGPVLVEDVVEVPPRARTAEVERAKTRLAATKVAAAIEALVEGRPGRPQAGTASTFKRSDLEAIRRVGDPSALTWAELERRIRAFELIELELAGRRLEVSALRRVGARSRGRAREFTTADGIRAEPSRLVHLPPVLYRAYRPLRARAR